MTSITRVQLSIGLAILLLGTLVYALDRPPEQALITAAIGLPAFTSGVFGPLGPVLPAFAHVFAFILLTTALIGNTRAVCLSACLGWWLIDTAFELGQHPYVADWLSTHLSRGPENLTIVNYTVDYFVHGTFDPWDLLAITLGVVAAYLVIEKTKQQEQQYE